MSGHDELPDLPCREFSEFKEALQQMRAVDDRIIYKLNTSVPTASFEGQFSAFEQCKDLYEQLRSLYTGRTTAIQTCVDETSDYIMRLKDRRETEGETPLLTKRLRKEQTKLRLMRVELGVEDVVKERSMKVFRERCWKSYKPSDP